MGISNISHNYECNAIPSSRVLVAGVGNPLMGDDGLGGYVVKKLQLRRWAGNVFILDMGCSPIHFLADIEKSDVVIVVDAVRNRACPGTIHRIVPHSPMAGQFPGLRYSYRDAHGFSILNAIQIARLRSGNPAHVIIYGIEPLNLSPGIGLSTSVLNSVPLIEKLVYNQIIKLSANS